MKNDIQNWFEMIQRLRSADSVWKDDELPVEMKQTHISVILLGKDRVLKLKKPVDFGFLDYTTLEKRRNACEQEIELNSRLCPEIYLGVQPVVEDENGIRFSYEGNIVDYGVFMKRLPEERMLDFIVENDTVSEPMIASIAGKLNEFHETARRGADVDAYGSLEVIRHNWEENFEQTERYVDRTISQSDFERIREWVYQWLRENQKLLKERIVQGHICDGHGDVRCESVCVTNGICIFDCIEFNERFRCADVVNEAAFLAMDLDAYGRPDLGYYFFERYSEKADDEQMFKLFSFYRCYRAFVRGKVLSFQLDELELTEEKRKSAKSRAKNYFAIASNSARQLQTPTMVAVAGLSGTGKTSVARAVAGNLGLRVVSSDTVRESLFGDSKKPADYGEGVYDKESNQITYQNMFEKGMELLHKDGGVILDATFRCAEDREEAKRKAESVGADWRLIECRLDTELARQRMEQRSENEDGLSDATIKTYERQKSEFDPIAIGEDKLFILNTEKDLSVSSRRASDWLRTNSKRRHTETLKTKEQGG